jgi:arylsulfatase A-like enzyme
VDNSQPATEIRQPAKRIALSPVTVVLLVISVGLCGGYLDLVVMMLKKLFLNSEGYVRSGRDFPWTVPLGHLVLLVIPGFFVIAVNWLRPNLVPMRQASWLFATLAIWAALARLSLYRSSSLILAAGIGPLIGDVIVAGGRHARRLRYIAPLLLGLLGILAVASSGRQAIRERHAIAGLPPSPPRSRNLVLIVWDTVRAYNVGLYGYSRQTTPSLTQLAQSGVTYRLALSPAPWTFPSHSSFFTGQWPFKLNSQWKFKLDTPGPTLAEYLASRGYQTAGFAANTNCCSYESGLARGFTHFDDYALTPWSLLSRTVPGKWILENITYSDDFYGKKWVGLQSRGAVEINDSFLGWLSQRRPDRPFFAFLNYFDAHEPFIPPAGFAGRFGTKPKGRGDYQFLVDYVGLSKDEMPESRILMARDCYDDCISFLDQQLGTLYAELGRKGLLESTDVIITSDHGESFGDHNVIGHSYTVDLDETGVPLVILSSGAPAGALVETPVTLRDLPATVVDLLGLSEGSPFPGRSLAALWKNSPGHGPAITSPALSEQANATAFQTGGRIGPAHPGFQYSLVALGHHYIRDGMGFEQLYNVRRDRYEATNLINSPQDRQTLIALRKRLLDVLIENPASVEVEAAYRKQYEDWLQALVRNDANPGKATSPAIPKVTRSPLATY